MECVRGIQYFFAISGYNMNISSNIYVKILLYVVLIFTLSLITFSGVFEIGCRNNELTYIQDWIVKIQDIFYISFYYILIFKISDIGKLVNILSINLSGVDIKKCYIFSYIVLFWFIISSSLNMLADEATSYSINRYKTMFGIPDTPVVNTVLWILKNIEFTKVHWSISIDIIYLHLFYAMYLSKSNILKKIDLNNSIDIAAKTISINCDIIIDIHLMFESTMSIFPFLTISLLFFSVSQAIYFFTFYGSITISLFVIINIISKSLSTLCLLFLTNHFFGKLRNKAREICKRIKNDERFDWIEKSIFSKMLETCSNQPITGWGMFNIDLSLILSFLASLVTFTILFLSKN